MTLANTPPSIRRQWRVNLHDARTGQTYTRIVSALTPFGALQAAKARTDDWTEAEICLPNGEQIAVFDRYLM